MSSTPRVGGSLVISSLLAALSYVPFKIVAKVSLFICVALFVFDPIPPLSRLLSLVLCGVVLLTTRVEREWREGQVRLEEIIVIESDTKKEQ